MLIIMICSHYCLISTDNSKMWIAIDDHTKDGGLGEACQVCNFYHDSVDVGKIVDCKTSSSCISSKMN